MTEIQIAPNVRKTPCAAKSPRTGRPSKVAPGEECRTVGVWLPVTVIDKLAEIGPTITEAARKLIIDNLP